MKLKDLLSSLPQSTLKGDEITLPDSVYRKIFRFAGLRKGDVFYHLGCGDGRAVELAVREFGVKKGVGIEINKKLAGKAQRRLARLKAADVVNEDMRRASISDASVLLFWSTDSAQVDKMLRRFRNELKDRARVITIWAPLGMTLPSTVEFPFFVTRKPFKRARSIRQQIKVIYGTNCIDFVASWLLAERYIDALEVVPASHRRFVNILQSMVIWINAWTMGVTCEDEVPPPVQTYVGILRTFFDIDLSGMITEKK